MLHIFFFSKFSVPRSSLGPTIVKMRTPFGNNTRRRRRRTKSKFGTRPGVISKAICQSRRWRRRATDDEPFFFLALSPVYVPPLYSIVGFLPRNTAYSVFLFIFFFFFSSFFSGLERAHTINQTKSHFRLFGRHDGTHRYRARYGRGDGEGACTGGGGGGWIEPSGIIPETIIT